MPSRHRESPELCARGGQRSRKDRHRRKNFSRRRLGGSLARRVTSLEISWRHPRELQYDESQPALAQGAHRSDPQVSRPGGVCVGSSLVFFPMTGRSKPRKIPLLKKKDSGAKRNYFVTE